jgi:thiamine biosynthesis lipoprotein
MLKAQGFHNFYVNAGGNIQVAGKTDDHRWRVGIRNPSSRSENVKGLARTKQGIAPSGTAIRGQHIYNPYHRNKPMLDSARITVIGLNVYEADQFATAACAMEKKRRQFIENVGGFKGYMSDMQGIATVISDFERYMVQK